MAHKIDFHPAAWAEAQAVTDWYAAEDMALAVDFMDELSRSLDEIADGPGRWSEWMHGTRRYLMHRFPYRIVYHHRAEVVFIYAIAHTSRRPDYWADRLNNGDS